MLHWSATPPLFPTIARPGPALDLFRDPLLSPGPAGAPFMNDVKRQAGFFRYFYVK